MRLPTTGNPENAKANFFAAGQHGYTGGSPGVEAPTLITADELNAFAGELAFAILGGGAALKASQYDQLDRVLKTRIELNAVLSAGLASVSVTSGVNGWASAGAGRIVAIGDSGYLATSDDAGATWTTRTPGSGSSGDFKQILWVSALGLYVATADGSIQTSADGASWVQRESPTGYKAVGLAYGNGVVCAIYWDVSTNTFAHYTSADGLTWAWDALGTGLGLRGIAFGAGVFVAGNSSSLAADANMYSSPDGLTWTARTLGSSAAIKAPLVTFSGGYFQAYGDNGSGRELQVSADGVTWTRVRTDSGTAGLGLMSTARAAYFQGSAGAAHWQVLGADCTSALDFGAPRFTRQAVVRWFGRSHVALCWIDSTHIGRSAPFVL